MKSTLIAIVVLVVAAVAAKGEPGANVQREVIERYVSATQHQSEALRGLKMDVDIDAKLPKLRKEGRLSALRNISKIGKISYIVRSFTGDTTVKKDVIARYLAAETQAIDDVKKSEMAITPDNYKFKYKGLTSRDSRIMHIFEVTPKSKRVGLFKGELWIDAETYLPLRETGRFVKNPSVFLKRVEFVREYQIQDGISLPVHIESTVDTRLVGRAELSINFSNFTRTEGGDEELAGSESGQSQ